MDALRGIAALAIVIYHYHHFYLADFLGRPEIPPIGKFPYAGVLEPLYSPFAAHAVELFWVISGFVFAHVYLPRHVTGRTFWAARFARLYPLHFASLMYVAALQAISLYVAGHWQIYGNNDVRHFLLQLLMSSNWTTQSWGLSFNGPIWSVSLEIVVYGCFFVSLFALRRAPLLVAAALCALAWTWIAFEPVHFPLVERGVFLCAGYFFLGALLCILRPNASVPRFAALVLVCLSGVAVGVFAELGQMIVAGSACTLLVMAVGLDRVALGLGARLRLLGDISYSLYLVHVPLQMTVLLVADILFDGTRGFADSYLTLPIYLAVSVYVAAMVHHHFERPAGQFIRKRLMR